VVRGEVVSWLRAASLTFPTVRSVVFEDAYVARYSGGAAPASHRFPWPQLV